MERLPASWASWARETAACAGAPVDYVALGLFAAVAGVAGAGVRAAPLTGWREPLVLWQCAVGPSGAGKSAALAATRKLIDALDDDGVDANDKTVPQHIVGEATLRALAGVVARNRGAAAAQLRLKRLPVSVIGSTRPDRCPARGLAVRFQPGGRTLPGSGLARAADGTPCRR